MNKKNWKMIRRITGFTLTSILLVMLVTGAICSVAFAMYINIYIKPKADINLTGLNMNFTSIVYYNDSKTGAVTELDKIHGEQNRIWVPMAEIPSHLGDAIIAIEDERFETHNGVDWKRTLAAAVNWVIPMKSSYGGGSTITQQLIKNTTAEDDFSIQRKLLEIFRALDVDARMEKDEILELYMNTVYFGRKAYGVQTAAQTYFGKDVNQLSLAECALIAGITNNPSYYDPFRFPENIKTRQTVILDQMLKQGKITQAEHDEAKAAPLEYKHAENKKEIETPQSYFIDTLMSEVINDLMSQKGFSRQIAAQMVYSGGLQIHATIDPTVQNALEEVYENPENVPGIKGKNGKYPQSAMVVLDPYTAQIKGIVGGKGEKLESRGLNRAAGTYRSPGSTIKPLSTYGPAFDLGLINPYSVITDMPQDVLGGKAWPINSTNGGDWMGQTTVNFAVEQSLNTVAIETLERVTPQKSFEYMTQRLGFEKLIAKQVDSKGRVTTDIDRAPLALGGLTKGVTVLEMAAGFATFANDGMYVAPSSYTKVLDSSGSVLLENKMEKTPAFDNEKTAHYITHMLTNAVKNGTAKVASMGKIATAGKTGSTSTNNDRWFVGYTPYYVGATWYGYDEQQRVSGAGANPSVTLWKMVMDRIHKGLPAKQFPSPEGFTSAAYCRDSGLSPTQWCTSDVRGSRAATGYYHKSDVPNEACTMHTGIEIDSVTNMAASEFCPEEQRKAVGILDLTRLFDVSVLLRDGDFTLTIENAPVGSGVPTRGKGERQYGIICTTHTEATVPPVDPENPDGTDPDNPGEIPPEQPTEPEEPVFPPSGGTTNPDNPSGGDTVTPPPVEEHP